jgi:hypothetical protein
VGDADAPAFGTLDPEILAWCEENGFHLVTGNRRSMPRHLADHLAAGRHIPGILAVRRGASYGEVIEILLLAVEASWEDEFHDRIEYIP